MDEKAEDKDEMKYQKVEKGKGKKKERGAEREGKGK